MFLMSSLQNVPLLKKSLLAWAMAGGLTFGVGAEAARADHCPPSRYGVHVDITARAPRTAYRTVTRYEIRKKPYARTVIRYDHCGRPCRDTVIRYRTVRVPVRKLIRVRY